ncbi:hypothetical protein [Nocardia sp. NBC_00416]|uniref:hypothetical protein n=1 Tax=Nocardia sp. NBC_00416 TaxID=2975991 RepID=UPI002E1B6C98
MEYVDIGVLQAGFRSMAGEDADPVAFAAAGITKRAWRNSEVEFAHGGNGLNRISDGEMFAANVVMFRLVHDRIRRGRCDWPALEMEVIRPDRVIAGRTVADYLGPLYEAWTHTVGAVFDTCSQIEDQHGYDYMIAMNAAMAPVDSVRDTDWGMPRWPDIVEAFLDNLDHTPPVNTEDLRTGLLTAPDTLGAEVLQWCINHGIGFTRP